MALRPKRLLKKLGLSLASLAVVGGGLELFARAQEPGPFSLFDRFPYFDSETAGHWRHLPGFRGRWDSTWYEIDDRGLRGVVQLPPDAENELRVVCIGDSCTFGKGVLEEASWPRQLEARLAAGGAAAQVYNLGINGAYGEVYSNVLAEHADALRPHFVVGGYNLNDFPNALRTIDEKVFRQRGLRSLIPQSVRDSRGRLALYRWVRAEYYDRQKAKDMAASESLASAASEGAEPNGEAWKAERAHLESIRDRAREHGARTVVFLFPYESQVLLEEFDRRPIERIRGLCDELGLPFVDLAEEFRREARAADPMRRLFIKGDRYHPNPYGYGIVADRVQALIAELGR